MGEIMDKNTLMKSRESLCKDIQIANKITGNEIFRIKTGVLIKFNFNDEQNIFGKVTMETSKISKIEGKMDSIKNIVDSRFSFKRIKLNYNQFYNFLDTLLNSLCIFFEKKLKNGMNKKDPIDNTIEICCICEEKFSNIMLNCLHLFCENCIETWLIKKQNNCPLCRVEIKITDNDEEKKNFDYCWNIIDLNQNEYIKDRNAIFHESLNEILKFEDNSKG